MVDAISQTFQGFHVRVTADDLDGGFIAECLELSGCMSQGETYREALENLVDAIAAVIEHNGRQAVEQLVSAHDESSGDDGESFVLAF